MSHSARAFAEYFHGGQKVFGRHAIACPPSVGDNIKVSGMSRFVVVRVEPKPLPKRSGAPAKQAPRKLYKVHLQLPEQASA